MIYVVFYMTVAYVLGLLSAHVWKTYVPTARDVGYCFLRGFLKLFQAMMKTVFVETSSITVQSEQLHKVIATTHQSFRAIPHPMEVDMCHLDAPDLTGPSLTGAVYCYVCELRYKNPSIYMEHLDKKYHMT